MSHDDQDIAQIREAVAQVCADFPGEYWRELDAERRYPEDFVKALTEAGFLGALIPEEYGGSGLGLTAACAILEEIQRARLQRRRLPRPDVHHGHPAAARQRGPEGTVATCRASPVASSACRPLA